MKRALLQWILPIAITVGLLALVFLWIEEPEKIPGYILSVPWHIHLIFIALTLFSMGIRAVRWRALLPGEQLTSVQCFGPLMIGFMMNSLFPARAGEFGRSIALSRQSHLPFSTALGSVLLERVFDGVVLLASFALVLTLLGTTLPEEAITYGGHEISGDLMRGAALSLAIVVIVMLAGIVAILFPRPRRLVEAITAACLPRRISDPLINQLEKLISGFHALRSPMAIASVLGLTIAVWAVVALSVWVAGLGFEGIEASYLESWAIVVFVCVAILLPASPGYWGLYEVGVIVGCTTLGLTDDAGLALGYSIVMHIWQIIPNVIIGLIYLWAMGLKLGQLRHSAPSSDEPEADPA